MLPELRMSNASQLQSIAAAEQKRRATVLVRDFLTVRLSASPSQHIIVHGGMRKAWLIEPVCFVAQDGDCERNAVSDGKPMKITKEIYGVLMTYG